MFTGIVETAVPVRSFQPVGTGARLVLQAPDVELNEAWRVARGQSIAVAGACLTVADLLEPGGSGSLADGREGADMAFDLSAETLARTWMGRLAEGTRRRINVERALHAGSRLDGHMVSGHVDGLGQVTAIEEVGDGGRLVQFEVPEGFERFLVDKGSVTIDGISLTVVEPEGRRFQVAVIPLTWDITSLGGSSVGDPVHLEADLVGKWIDRLLAARGL